MIHISRPVALATLLISVAAQAADVAAPGAVRPHARATSPIASSIDTVPPATGESVGAKYLRELKPELKAQIDKEGQSLLGEEKGADGSYGGYIRAVAIFHQSKKRVFELMTDTATQALYLPHIVNAIVAAKPTNGELTQFALKFLWSDVKFRVQHWFYPEMSRSEWNLDTSVPHDIKAQEGYWQLYELDANTTVGEYGTKVETGMAVPKFIQDMFARGDIPKALTAFRKYMDSNGKYRRED